MLYIIMLSKEISETLWQLGYEKPKLREEIAKLIAGYQGDTSTEIGMVMTDDIRSRVSAALKRIIEANGQYGANQIAKFLGLNPPYLSNLVHMRHKRLKTVVNFCTELLGETTEVVMNLSVDQLTEHFQNTLQQNAQGSTSEVQ